MGSCAPSKANVVVQHRTEMMPIVKEQSANPRELKNGDTFIPINYLTGEYAEHYPKWLRYDISPHTFSYMIQQLNILNKASPVFKYKRYLRLSTVKAKVAKENDERELDQQTHKLLLDLNTQILNPLGLNAISNGHNVGIIIRKIHFHMDISHDTIDRTVIMPVYEFDNDDSSQYVFTPSNRSSNILLSC